MQTEINSQIQNCEGMAPNFIAFRLCHEMTSRLSKACKYAQVAGILADQQYLPAFSWLLHL